MDSNNKGAKKRTSGDYEAPKVPYVWLATTFIAPILVVVVPQVFEKSTSLTTLIIIALALLSVLLFVMWLMTHFSLYAESYDRQVVVLKLDNLENRIEKNGKALKALEDNSKRLEAENERLLDLLRVYNEQKD